MRASCLLPAGAGLALVALLFCAGCAVSTSSGNGPVTPVISYSTPTQTAVSPSSAPTAASPGGLDTTINIHFNDYDCLDVQKELGETYLNPGERYAIRVSPPTASVNINLLMIDVGDREKIQTVRPEWNAVTKSWNYAGLVPLVQFNDVSTVQEKTVTIKNQGKYYLCADDRKESGVNDAIIRVPVKMTKTN